MRNHSTETLGNILDKAEQWCAAASLSSEQLQYDKFTPNLHASWAKRKGIPLLSPVDISDLNVANYAVLCGPKCGAPNGQIDNPENSHQWNATGPQLAKYRCLAHHKCWQGRSGATHHFYLKCVAAWCYISQVGLESNQNLWPSEVMMRMRMMKATTKGQSTEGWHCEANW